MSILRAIKSWRARRKDKAYQEAFDVMLRREKAWMYTYVAELHVRKAQRSWGFDVPPRPGY